MNKKADSFMDWKNKTRELLKPSIYKFVLFFLLLMSLPEKLKFELSWSPSCSSMEM